MTDAEIIAAYEKRLEQQNGTYFGISHDVADELGLPVDYVKGVLRDFLCYRGAG